jgi:redox-sensitive bicupin YhaK (pirin superfamily)
VLRGAVLVNNTDIAREAQFVLLDRTGGEVTLEANNDATVLILSGQPIDEPAVMHGPFVMNTVDEIRQAMVDFQRGGFGAISAEPESS